MYKKDKQPDLVVSVGLFCAYMGGNKSGPSEAHESGR